MRNCWFQKLTWPYIIHWNSSMASSNLVPGGYSFMRYIQQCETWHILNTLYEPMYLYLSIYVFFYNRFVVTVCVTTFVGPMTSMVFCYSSILTKVNRTRDALKQHNRTNHPSGTVDENSLMCSFFTASNPSPSIAMARVGFLHQSYRIILWTQSSKH